MDFVTQQKYCIYVQYKLEGLRLSKLLENVQSQSDCLSKVCSVKRALRQAANNPSIDSADREFLLCCASELEIAEMELEETPKRVRKNLLEQIERAINANIFNGCD